MFLIIVGILRVYLLSLLKSKLRISTMCDVKHTIHFKLITVHRHVYKGCTLG